MTNLMSIARAMGGEVAGDHVMAPGPGHSARDRSLGIWIDPSAPDLLRVHSHAGDDRRACLDYVKARRGLTEVQP